MEEEPEAMEEEPEIHVDKAAEAERPLKEAGQGEAEGFELAEEALIEHASHGDSGPDPTYMAGLVEDGEGPVGEYGEADDIRVSERSDDDDDES
jgi:hypothetical protein